MPGHHQRCAKCDSTIFVHVPHLGMDATPAREVGQMVATALRVHPPEVLRLHLTAHVCLACGRTELYAADVQGLCALASDAETGVLLLDVTAAGEI